MDRDEIYAGLLDRGLPPHVAEGIVWNLQDESGLDPSISEIAPIVPGSRGGYGLAQWTGPRRNALEEAAAQAGVPASDPNLQLDFLMRELQGPEQGAYRSLMAAGSPEDAAAAFATDFLRPAKPNLDRRVAEYTGGHQGNALGGYESPPQDRVNALLAALEGQKAPERPRLDLWQGLDPRDFLTST